MAFSSSLRRGSRDAGTVRLIADTGEFNAKVEQAERQWRESVGSMSKEAIKLDLAQDRLKRSLAQYGAESSQAKRATIQLKDAQEAATRSARGLDRANDGARRSFTGLRAAAVGAVASVGVYGLASALRSAVDAAKESELVLGQTKLAVEAAGQSWETYESRILAVVAAQSKLGFDDEKLLKTFSSFVTRTKDVSEALELNALAADVARGRYIDLEQAAQIVLKASLGQSGALRRMGIDVEKNATSVQLLARLTEAYGGRAQGALGTATAATERMNVSIENAEELIGGALTPAVADLANRISDYLDDAGRQEEIQRRVNELVSDGAAVVRGLAGGMRLLKENLGPVVDKLGGLEKVTQALFAAALLRRVGLMRLGIRNIGIAAATSTGQIAAMGGAATVAAGNVGRLAALARGLNVASIAGFAAVLGAQYLHNRFDEPNQITRDQLLDPDTRKRIEDAVGKEGLAKLDAAFYEANYGKKPSGPGGPGGLDPMGKTKGGGSVDKGDGLSTLQRLELSAKRAAQTTYLSDDLKAAQAIEAYYAKIASNEKLKGDKLYAAQNALLDAQARTQAVEDQIAADRLSAQQKAAAKREAAEQKLKAQRQREAERIKAFVREENERVRERNLRAMKSNANMLSDLYKQAGLTPDGRPDPDSPVNKKKGEKEGITQADLDRLATSLISGFAEIQRKFAPNFQLDTHVLTHATREQTAVLREGLAPRRYRESAGLREQSEVVFS